MNIGFLNIALITIFSILNIGCGSEEEPFVCATNTVFLFAGASEKWCGQSEFRQYSYDEIQDRESGQIFVKFPAGNVFLIFGENGKLEAGNRLTYLNGLTLSGDVGSVNSASLTILKIDRTQELIDFEFDLDYHAQSNLTHWDVIGTVTDMPLKVE